MERDFKAFLMSSEFSDIEEFYSISHNNRIAFEDNKTSFFVKYFIRESKYGKKYTMDKHFQKILKIVSKKFYNDINKIIERPCLPIYLNNHPIEIDEDIYERYQDNIIQNPRHAIHPIEIPSISNDVTSDRSPNYCHKLKILKNGLPIPYLCRLNPDEECSIEEDEEYCSMEETESEYYTSDDEAITSE